MNSTSFVTYFSPPVNPPTFTGYQMKHLLLPTEVSAVDNNAGPLTGVQGLEPTPLSLLDCELHSVFYRMPQIKSRQFQ